MLILAQIGVYSFPVLMVAVPLYAWFRGVPVYETFVKGAQDGLRTVLRTLPYLVAIFVGVSCFRGSGALGILSDQLGVVLGPLGIPADMLPLLVIRPISGSGALALTGDLLQHYGPDSPHGLLASILQGATDTTFFVITVYFGAVEIKKTRHALGACLFGDLCGFVAGFLIWKSLMR